MEDASDASESNSDVSIDPELKEQCEAAKDSQGLYTLETNTYQTSVLNSLLSSLNMRLEHTQSVIVTIRKREKEKAALEKELKKRQAAQAKEDARNQKKQQQLLEKQRKKRIDEINA